MPVCTESTVSIQPCREFCQKVYNSCAKEITKNGIRWPEKNACHLLPKKGEGVCIREPLKASSSDSSKPSSNSNQNSKQNSQSGSSSGGSSSGGSSLTQYVIGVGDYNQSANSIIEPARCKNIEVTCPAHLKLSLDDEKVSRNRYTFLTTQKRDVSYCGAPCESGELFWSETDRFIIRTVVAIFSAISIVTTTFAIATYLTESNRFRYPEKPIIWLAVCYFFISLSYLCGSLTQNDISCTTLSVGDLQPEQERVVSQGTDRTSCTLNFMLLYFFTIAAGVWWIILALTWLLAAGLKWSSEAIERISQYFHFGAWGLPTVLTLIILSQGKVDGDSLSGVCFTGQLDSGGLYSYVFLPLTICLGTGCVFLIIGFVALFRIRKNFKRNTTNTGIYTSSSGPVSIKIICDSSYASLFFCALEIVLTSDVKRRLRETFIQIIGIGVDFA